MRYLITSFAILLVLIAFDSVQTLAKDPGSGHSSGGAQSSDHQSSGSSGSNARSSGGNFSGSGSNARSSGSNARSSGGNFSNPGSNTRSSGSNFSNPGSNARGGAGFDLNKGFNKGMDSGKSVGPGMNSQKSFDGNTKFDSRHRPEFSGGRGEGREDWRYRWDNNRWWFWGPGNHWMWYSDGRWYDYNNAYIVGRPIYDNFSGGPIKIVNPANSGVTLNYTLNGNLYTIQPGYSQDLQEDRAWVIQFSRGPDLDQARYGLTSGVYTFTRTDRGWELFRRDFQLQ